MCPYQKGKLILSYYFLGEDKNVGAFFLEDLLKKHVNIIQIPFHSGSWIRLPRGTRKGELPGTQETREGPQGGRWHASGNNEFLEMC